MTDQAKELLAAENRRDAEEFCQVAFGPLVTDVSQYVEMVVELMRHATERGRLLSQAKASSPSPARRRKAVSFVKFKLLEAGCAAICLPIGFSICHIIFGERPHITEFEAGAICGVVLLKLIDSLRAKVERRQP